MITKAQWIKFVKAYGKFVTVVFVLAAIGVVVVGLKTCGVY